MGIFNTMKARRLFRKDANGVNTMHDLLPEHTGSHCMRFNHLILRKEPVASLFICIYRYDRRNGFQVVDKLSFRQFTEKYIEKGTLISYHPMSTIYIIIQTPKDNGLILLADNNQVNFQNDVRNEDKINYSDIPEFDFELFYETAA